MRGERAGNARGTPREHPGNKIVDTKLKSIRLAVDVWRFRSCDLFKRSTRDQNSEEIRQKERDSPPKKGLHPVQHFMLDLNVC